MATTTDQIILDCLDSALSKVDFVDKPVFYQMLEKSGVELQEISRDFSLFHEFIKNCLGEKHYQIERLMVNSLHEKKSPKHSAQVEAFIFMVNFFSEDIRDSIEQRKELLRSEEHARNLEEKVRLVDEKLKLAERMAAIGETAAMVGHDIRNPLQGIAGDLYLIDNDVASLPEGEVKKSLQESIISIQANLLYIDKIILDLQDYARPLKPRLERVDLEKVIEEVFLSVPIAKNIEVNINLDKQIPSLKTDFTMLKRIVTNLVNNAVQAMPEGGKLAVRTFCKNGKMVISVEDTGTGIPEEVKAKLFTPMVTTKAKGQGFGLAVVKRLADALNGTISFESEKDKGTKFQVELPTK